MIMARLEFAILQYLEGNVRIVLQRDEKDLLERLLRRTREMVPDYSQDHWPDIEKAIQSAFQGLIQEFKDETIRIV